jgi:parallel beta-helix repeat protein
VKVWSIILAISLLAGTAAKIGRSEATSMAAVYGLMSRATGQASSRTNMRVANNFPGADLGAKINAADRDLGSRAGEILVRDGGTISTQVILSPGHSLRFSAGTFRVLTQLQDEGAFLLKSRTAVTGSGWDTIIVEPPRVGWIVFQSFADIRTQPTHTGSDSDISMSNLQIKGANPAVEGSVRQTVNLGNCHRCKVERVWFNSTGVIGVAAGGSGLTGNFADTFSVRNNLFTHVAGQGAAVVNGRNIIIDGNTFKDSGRDPSQGAVAIDVEPNVEKDIAQHIEITNNTIDSSGSTFLHGNGIVVQNGALTRPFGPILIKNNQIIGGQMVPNISGNIAVGIYMTSRTEDVTVVNNTVRRVAHSGIRLESTTRNYVANNTLVSTGTGGILAFEVIDTTDSKIVDNVVSVDPRSPLGNSVIQETGKSRNNIYSGNTDGKFRINPSIRH